MGIVSKVTWQPDFVQKDVIVHGKRKKNVDRIVNSSFCRKTVHSEFLASKREWSKCYSIMQIKSKPDRMVLLNQMVIQIYNL